jgi:hypothetical protein
MTDQPPGLRWIAILGAAGFAAGFFGPIVFVPEANQGPMVGIFISGPAGAVVGLLLYAACSVLKVPARSQWRLLCAVATVGVVATLVSVQPKPALRGHIRDVTVVSCSRPLDAEPAVLLEWRKHIAGVTWAKPRPGWEQDMHAVLRDAPGVLLAVDLVQQRSIYENRKPWNRGGTFATSWEQVDGEKSLFDAEGVCSDFPAGRALRTFQGYDLNLRIDPPDEWPPRAFDRIIGAWPHLPVPPEFAAL